MSWKKSQENYHFGLKQSYGHKIVFWFSFSTNQKSPPELKLPLASEINQHNGFPAFGFNPKKVEKPVLLRQLCFSTRF